MADPNNLEQELGALLPRVALAPVIAVAALALAVSGLRGLLWYLAIIAPVSALAALWYGRRVGRALTGGPRARERRSEASLQTPAAAPAGRRSGTPKRSPAQRKLAAARVRAQRSLRASQVARELALTSLRIHADACAVLARLDAPTDGDERSRIERVASDSKRAYRQLHALLPEIGHRHSAHWQPGVDVGRAVQRAIELMRPRADRLGVSVALSKPDVTPICAGDIRSLQSVFAQLLDNAIAAAHERKAAGSECDPAVTIAISAPARGLAAFIDIVDTGAGLPGGDPARLFAPDFSTRGSGRGAGLAVSRHLLTRIGGFLELSPAADGSGVRARVGVPYLAVCPESRPVAA